MIKTITETRTETSNTLHLALRSQHLSLETGAAKLDELATAIIEHADDKDELSKELLRWGVEFLNHVDTCELEPSDQSLLERAKKLEEILEDPIHRRLVYDPVIVQTKAGPQLWDNAVFKRYQELSLRVFHRNVIANPHPLAGKILDLCFPTRKVVQYTQEISSFSPTAMTPMLSQEDVNELITFENRINLVPVEKEQIMLIQKLNTLGSVALVELKKNEVALAEGLQQFEKQEQERTEYVRESLSEIREESEKRVKITEGLLQEVKKVQAITQSRLEESTAENATLKNQVNALRSHLGSMQSQLNNMSQPKGGGWCIIS